MNNSFLESHMQVESNKKKLREYRSYRNSEILPHLNAWETRWNSVTVHLSSNSIVKQLKQKLKQFKDFNMEELNLSNYNLENFHLQMLQNTIRFSKNLKTIKLDNN